jgi:hypothetical protein
MENDYKKKEANTKIWIADDTCINCNVRYSWFHKVMAKLLLGWRVE